GAGGAGGMAGRGPSACGPNPKVPGKGERIILGVARPRAVELNGLADIAAVRPARIRRRRLVRPPDPRPEDADGEITARLARDLDVHGVGGMERDGTVHDGHVL